jgi:hypothetical protein
MYAQDWGCLLPLTVPRWLTYHTLDPLDPCSGTKTEVMIPMDYVDRLNKYRPIDWYNLRTAVKVFDAPTRIFYGLRQLTEGGWCYVGKPDQWWVREEVIAPFPKTLVFAVYLKDDLTVYNHRAERADADDPLSPKGWAERYQKLVWKSNN